MFRTYLLLSKDNPEGRGGIVGCDALLFPLPFVLINDVSLPCLGVLGRINSSFSSARGSKGIGFGNGIEIRLKSCGLGGSCGG